MNTDRIIEMITKRFKDARGIHEDTAFYGFYARVSGESRELDTRKNRLIFGMLGALAPWRHDDRRQAA